MGGRVAINETGNTYGNLVVLGRVGLKGKQAVWLCSCLCGNTVSISGSSLRGGRTTSCGCSQRDVITRHAMCNTPTYRSWTHMKNRCDNENYSQYADYGGRGITYDIRWASFENFLEDMGERPQGLTLDRINNNSGYFPENCRWTNNSEQGYNQRRKRTNTSGVTGVYWCSTRKKWKAEIKLNGQKITLGSFVLFDVAVCARKQAELKYYGYNKIEDPEDAT